MTESSKTIAFAAAALLVVGLAVVTKPSTGEYDPSELLGEMLFDQFDPDEAKRLSIVAFEEDTATIRPFEVAERDGLWTLPSKSGYPADAEEQFAKAIVGLSDLKILQIVSQNAEDHAEYGVVDPKSPKLKPGQTGVGLRVSLAKEDGDTLADVIIGKQVKDQPEQRYVRRAGAQDAVFVTKITPSDFSTDFSEWIEKDLLDIDTQNISQFRIKDFTSELFITREFRLGGDINFRSDITLAVKGAGWELAGLAQSVDPETPALAPAKLAEDEELNTTKIDDVKFALSRLRLVDVSPKPKALSEALKAGKEIELDEAGFQSLLSAGFAPMSVVRAGSAAQLSADAEVEFLSTEGELICTMSDGVEYVLRFGNLRLDSSGQGGTAEPAEEESADAADDSGEGAEAVNRYLFVTARVSRVAIPMPELEDVPDLPTNAVSSDADGDEGETDAGGQDGNESDEADSEESDAAESEGADSDDEGEAGEDSPSLEDVIARRKEIESRNAIRLEAYEAQVKSAEERVNRLNARFGDWYYVIADESFAEIHLSREDVIKKKEPEEGEAAPGAAPAVEAPAKEEVSEFGAPGTPVPGLPGAESFGMDSESETPEEQPDSEDQPEE